MKTYFENIGVALSQVWNTLWGGEPDETICSRAWRLHCRGSRTGTVFVKVVNGLFFWQSNHCRGAFVSEVERRHVPKEIQEAGQS